MKNKQGVKIYMDWKIGEWATIDGLRDPLTARVQKVTTTQVTVDGRVFRFYRGVGYRYRMGFNYAYLKKASLEDSERAKKREEEMVLLALKRKEKTQDYRKRLQEVHWEAIDDRQVGEIASILRWDQLEPE